MQKFFVFLFWTIKSYQLVSACSLFRWPPYVTMTSHVYCLNWLDPNTWTLLTLFAFLVLEVRTFSGHWELWLSLSGYKYCGSDPNQHSQVPRSVNKEYKMNWIFLSFVLVCVSAIELEDIANVRKGSEGWGQGDDYMS